MATLLTNTTAKAIGSYVGETKKQIRDGLYLEIYKCSSSAGLICTELKISLRFK